jgi:hypothetical protein
MTLLGGALCSGVVALAALPGATQRFWLLPCPVNTCRIIRRCGATSASSALAQAPSPAQSPAVFWTTDATNCLVTTCPAGCLHLMTPKSSRRSRPCLRHGASLVSAAAAAAAALADLQQQQGSSAQLLPAMSEIAGAPVEHVPHVHCTLCFDHPYASRSLLCRTPANTEASYHPLACSCAS